MIKRIGCIEIPVSNMEKAVSFYETVLELKKAYEHPVWASFDVGGTSFALAASGIKPSKEAIKTCSSCSLCVLRFAAGKTRDNKPSAYAVLNLEVGDLDEAYEKLRAKGVRFVTEPKKQAWGGRTAIVLDPDSNMLVLTQTS